MLSRVVWGQVGPAASSTDVVHGPGLVGLGDCPAEAGELASDGDRDDRAPLAALAFQSAPDVVQALLGLPGDRDHRRGLAVLAALKRLAAGGALAVLPGGLDQQPSGVSRTRSS